MTDSEIEGVGVRNAYFLLLQILMQEMAQTKRDPNAWLEELRGKVLGNLDAMRQGNPQVEMLPEAAEAAEISRTTIAAAIDMTAHRLRND